MTRLLRRPLRRGVFLPLLLGLFGFAAVACTAAPAPAPAPPPPAPAPAPIGGQPTWPEASLLAQVNAQRANAGAAPLAWCAALGRAASQHSLDQATRNLMTHYGLYGSNVGMRADYAGYLGWSNLGENIAAGFTSEAAVLTAWMASPPHRANVLNPVFTHVGSGFASSANGTVYWTQDFGRNGTC
jgi:uncharacterized protein YkwD